MLNYLLKIIILFSCLLILKMFENTISIRYLNYLMAIEKKQPHQHQTKENEYQYFENCII